MKQTINSYEFAEAFRRIRPNNFTYDGLLSLFDYLEDLEADTGEELELDVIGLCCDYSEYANIAEFQKDYSTDYETVEDIERKTVVIRVDDESFIIQNF